MVLTEFIQVFLSNVHTFRTHCGFLAQNAVRISSALNKEFFKKIVRRYISLKKNQMTINKDSAKQVYKEKSEILYFHVTHIY